MAETGVKINQGTQKLAQAIINAVEENVDEELRKLDQLDSSTIEELREARLKELAEQHKRLNEWQANGHGNYTEIEEKDFFTACKVSPEIVVCFYRTDIPNCKIYDLHLKIIASKHLEARFVKINAEKAPFLTGRLKIKTIPTLVIIVGGKIKEYVQGFSYFGNRYDFKTEELMSKLGSAGVIDYEDESLPSVTRGFKDMKIKKSKRTIKDDSSSEDSD